MRLGETNRAIARAGLMERKKVEALRKTAADSGVKIFMASSYASRNSSVVTPACFKIADNVPSGKSPE